MSDRTRDIIIILCMLAVIGSFLIFMPIWFNIVFYAILGWLWGGRKVRKQQEQEEIKKQEGIEK